MEGLVVRPLGDNGGKITLVPVDGMGVLGDLLAMVLDDCHGLDRQCGVLLDAAAASFRGDPLSEIAFRLCASKHVY